MCAGPCVKPKFGSAAKFFFLAKKKRNRLQIYCGVREHTPERMPDSQVDIDLLAAQPVVTVRGGKVFSLSWVQKCCRTGGESLSDWNCC